jgi:hypothetical protein
MQIFDLVFDIDELLHRQCDLLGAWDAGLMTTGEAKMLGDLLFAEDDGATLVQLYREVLDEELELNGFGGRVPLELSVALARLATNIDVVARLGSRYRQMVMRLEASKDKVEPGVEDWAEVYAELTDIITRQSPCMDTVESRVRFMQVKAALIKKITPLAIFAGYDQAEFTSAIEMARARAAGEA